MRVVKREAIFIPVTAMTKTSIAAITEKLTFSFYGKEKICEECEYPT